MQATQPAVPTKSGYSFTPASRSYTHVMADASAEDYAASTSSPYFGSYWQDAFDAFDAGSWATWHTNGGTHSIVSGALRLTAPVVASGYSRGGVQSVKQLEGGKDFPATLDWIRYTP